jgi:hypothetical protein
MAIYEITAPDGQVYEVNAPDDATEQQVLQYAQSQFQTQPAQVAQPQQTQPPLYDRLKRQAGLTGRAITSGLVGTADFLASPVRELANLALPEGKEIQPLTPQLMQYFPEPQNERERLVQNIGQSVVGAGTGIGAARLAQPVTQTGQAIKSTLASAPIQQLGGAAGAGAGAGIVAEGGGGAVEQILGGLAGGIAGASGAGRLQSLGTTVGERLARPPQPQQQLQVDIKIDQALKPSGVKLADLEPSLRQSLRDDVIKATQVQGKLLSPNAIRRLADYKLTGATPTQGRLTGNPAIVTKEKNLAKQGVNSTDPKSQSLAMLENENNQVLLSKIDDLGAVKAVDQYQAGQSLRDTLAAFGKTQKDNISNLYKNAIDSSGRAAELDGYTFTQTANKALDQQLKTKFLPREIKGYLNQVAKGELPLTVDVAEQLKTTIASSQRATIDGNVKQALGIVYDALETAPLKSNQQLGQASLSAFRQARNANKAFKQQEQSIPAFKAAMEGMEPDTFFDKFVIRGDYNSLQKTLQFVDSATKETIKNNVVAYVKNAATNGQPNETARISGDAMRKAIAKIGDNKLKLLFTPDEIAQLKSIERVAKYEGFLPVGSAVNVSNTASALMGRTAELLANSPLVGKIPFGSAIVGEPARNIQIGIGARQAFDVPRALTREPLDGVVSRPFIGSPYLGIGGLLQNEEQQ